MNAFGAALLPHLNMYANNLTLWDLSVEDIQVGAATRAVRDVTT